MKHPRDAFINQRNIIEQWEQLNYLGPPVMEETVTEFENFVTILDSLEVDIQYLPSSHDTGLDSIYVRDASLPTDNGLIVCRMGKDARAAEPGHQKKTLEELGMDILGEIKSPGLLEGGDATWITKDLLAVGLGYRTNMEGIRQLKDLLSGSAEVVPVQLPHFKGPSDVFHLMSIFSPVDRDLAVVYSPLMPVYFRQLLLSHGYSFIEIPESEFESHGCNVLAMGPRKCLLIKGNPITKRRLEEAGATVADFEGNEICIKGCGGPTCLTRPLLRDI